MGKESEAPLLGDSPKLLSRVSYLLADRLRTQIRDQLKVYQPANISSGGLSDNVIDPEIKFTFEIPGDDAKGGKSTLISVFLYDVHEDTALRHSAMPAWRAQYPSSAGRRPIRLCYLITCWFGQKESGKGSVRDEQYAMQVSDALLSALISLRGRPLIPDAFYRILPPSEKLFSLGQFWQSLKDSRPRLTLGLTITVPYAPPEQKVVPVPEVKLADVVIAPIADGALRASGDDDVERIVRLVLMLSRASAKKDAAESIRATQSTLDDVLSTVAKKWRDAMAHPSLLSLRAVTAADASDFVALRGRLAEHSATVQWCRDSNARREVPLDAAVHADLLKRSVVNGTTLSDAVTVLDDVAEVSWRAWKERKAQGVSDPSSSALSDASHLSVGDMMALAGAFACVALAERLKKSGPDETLLSDDNGERR